MQRKGTVVIRADVVERLRARAGLSLEALAGSVPIDVRTLQRWLAGQPAWFENVASLAKALGVDFDRLTQPIDEGVSFTAADSASSGPTCVSSLFQLPAEVANFTGREDEIMLMVGLLRGEGRTVGLSALRGMGGIGKTSLAVKVAHLAKDRFPDAQLILDLQGMSDRPVTVVEAMSRIIRDFHPKIQELPQNEAELLPIYRSALAGKRALILLDNARSETQVQHLVTIPPPVGFIVTSRNALALDGMESVRLGVLSPTESLALLRGIVHEKGTDDELGVVVELCDKLPLAIRVAGDFLRLYENWSVARYADALRDENKRLARLKGKTTEKDVEAVLALSE